MTNMIEYTTTILGKDFLKVKAESYEAICTELNCYEHIVDDRPVKLYLDIDYGKPIDCDEEYNPDMTEYLIAITKKIMSEVCNYFSDVEPEYSISTANSPSFKKWEYKKTLEQRKTYWKVSIHIVVNNFIATKATQGFFIKEFNKLANNNSDWKDYMGDVPTLFDENIYDTDRKFRSVYASKEGENRPLVIQEGTFEMSCITAFIPENAVLFPEPIQPEKSIVTQKPNINESTTYHEVEQYIRRGCLSSRVGATKHLEWINTGIQFLCLFSDEEALTLWELLTELHGTTKKKEMCIDHFKHLTRKEDDKGKVLNTIRKWARTENQVEYNLIKKEIKAEIVEKETTKNEIVNPNISSKLIAESDVEARDIIYEMVKTDLKCIHKRLFYKSQHIWRDDQDIIDKTILNIILKSNIWRIKYTIKGHQYIAYSQNISSAKHILEALYVKVKTENNDDDLYEKFHSTTKNRICFKDGVLDFKNKKFYLWDAIDFEYYSCICINREFNKYFNNPDHKVINELKTELYESFYGHKLDLALKFQARAITGNYEDKNFATYMGNRDCGKGGVYDNLECGFEKYVKTFELGNILYNRMTSGSENVDCSKKLYWLLDLEFVRLAISQEIPEPSTGLKASGKMLKKIAGGGDTIVARRNYDKFDTHFKIDTTFMIMGNNSLQVDSSDCMEHQLEFESVIQYKSQSEMDMLTLTKTEMEMLRYKVKNPTIKDKCKSIEWGNAIVYLLYQNWTSDILSVIPEANDDDHISIIGTIEKIYTITNDKNDLIVCNVLYETMNISDKKKVDLELKSINIMKKQATSGPNRKKWCYYGLKVISKIEDTNI